MQLKSLPSVVRTWQPVIEFAFANSLPERPRRLTGRQMAKMNITKSAKLELERMLEKSAEEFSISLEDKEYKLVVFIRDFHDAYDNKRGPNGENIIFIANKGGWKMAVLPILGEIPELDTSVVDGIAFNIPDIKDEELDYINGKFRIDNKDIEAI